MIRYLGFVWLSAAVGLAIVGGHVESVKTGYHIRQLGIQKRALQHDVKKLEYRLAKLKTPEKLEAWMIVHNVDLTSPRQIQIASLPRPAAAPSVAGRTPTLLARLFPGTAPAQADQ